MIKSKKNKKLESKIEVGILLINMDVYNSFLKSIFIDV